MSLYDEIKSPFSNKETLRKLVEIYANEDEAIIRVIGDRYLYNKTIRLNKEQEKSHSEYQERMYGDLYLYNMDKLYSDIKRIDTDKYDKSVEEYIKYAYQLATGQPYDDNKIIDKDMEKIFKRYMKMRMYPLNKYKDIFSNYESYTDFVEQNSEICKLVDELGGYYGDKRKQQEIMDELKKRGITTEDEIMKFKTYSRFFKKMHKKFKRRRRCNGFSCKSTKLNSFSNR